uniref:PX domain-containing protein n=1 Tax=Panagrellus redivivus TaxID=6233 RepID=A0A7E5A093_PANRE
MNPEAAPAGMAALLPADIAYPLSCDIGTWSIEDGHVIYVIDCQRSILNHKWTIRRRYNEFAALNRELAPYGMDFGLPPKKTFGNLKPDFVRARKVALQEFIDKVTVHPLLFCNEAVLNFLEAPAIPDKNEENQVAATHIRNFRDLVITKRWEENGWRYCKLFYQVISQSTKNMYVYTWLPYGRIRPTQPGNLIVIFEFLRKLKFPYFLSPEKVMADRHGIGLLTEMKPRGSLRDRLFGKRPEGSFWEKYNVQNEIVPLADDEAREVAKDVLEGLIALQKLGVPYTSIHCGNVYVTENGSRLSEIEQCITNQNTMHYPSMIKNKYVNTIDNMMVINFGHFVYEMLTGIMVFPEHDAITALSRLPRDWQYFLQRIFVPDKKYGLPSLCGLANDPLFENITPFVRDCYLSAPLVAKALLETIRQKYTQRFHADKAAFNERRRIDHFQELIQSDAERNRRRELVLAQLRNNSDNTK